MVVDVDEVETDAPRRSLEEHLLGLSDKSIVDRIFELVGINSSKPLKNAVAARCVSSLFGDVVDGGLFDSGVKSRWPGIIGVEGPALDPSIGSWPRCSSAKLSWSEAVMGVSGL